MRGGPPPGAGGLPTPRGLRSALVLLAAGAAYVALCIALQAGARVLGLALLALIGAVLLIGAIAGGVRFHLTSLLVAAVIPLLLWVGVWGSYSYARDVLGGALGLTLAWPVARALTRRREAARGGRRAASAGDDRPRRRLMRRFLLSAFVLIWIINSSLNVIFESATLPRERAPLRAARADGAPWPTVRLGVALSGGGYRAALMHAGVLAELDAMRVPVSAVSCVSGGSIVGAFYAAGGAPADFRDAVAGGRLNLKRDMADMHNALRLPLPFRIPYLEVALVPWWSFGRVDVQANLVDRVLLGGTTLHDMRAPDRPRLQVCTTDLRTGTGVGLAADGAAIRSAPRPAPTRTGGAIPYDVSREFHPGIDPQTRLAELVAASGAFPGAFGAVDTTLPAAGGLPERRLLLADGGIVDNWGVGLLLDRAGAARADDEPWSLDLLLVSAGGRVFQVAEEVPAPEELRRAIDIVYETAGWRPVELVDRTDRPPIVLLQPADADPASAEYRAFAAASTLTDRFSEREAQLLYDLGRQLVRDASGELAQLLDAAATRRSAAPFRFNVRRMKRVRYLSVGGQRLDYAWFGEGADGDPVLVLLHDGLGSISTWRDFPARLAERTGLAAFAYSRAGYGHSSPASLPRPVSFMHDEARLLPAVCAAAGIRRAILVGHSDGASIALLHAGVPQREALRIDGLVLIAPHVFVEDITASSIRELRESFRLPLVRDRLAAHHADPEHTFGGWSTIWLAQAFRDWNIEACLPKVRVPVLLVQGDRDEFGTAAQLDAIERGIPRGVTRRMLPGCGHSPHREAEDATLDALATFLGGRGAGH